jgi:hypothetical protein
MAEGRLNPKTIDWLIIYGFTSRLRIFHSYGDVTIAGEGLLWLGVSVFPVSSEGPPDSVTSYDTQGDAEDLFY